MVSAGPHTHVSTCAWSHHCVINVFPSGFATYSFDQRSILVSNLVNGIDAYAVSPSMRLIQSYRHSIRCNVPLQVTTALQGAWIVGGSDDGSVRLFDQATGQLIQCLRHGDGMLCLHVCISPTYHHHSRNPRASSRSTSFGPVNNRNQSITHSVLSHILKLITVWSLAAPLLLDHPILRSGYILL